MCLYLPRQRVGTTEGGTGRGASNIGKEKGSGGSLSGLRGGASRKREMGVSAAGFQVQGGLGVGSLLRRRRL